MASTMNTTTGTALQRRNIHQTVTIICVLVVALVAFFFYRALQPRPMSAAELSVNNAFVFEAPRSLPEVALTDSNGKSFTVASLVGDWHLIFFGFTFCPDICPTTMSLLNQFYAQLPPDVQQSTNVVMTTVDPARDTPATLKPYVEYFNPAFIGLTGEFMDVHRFATALNMPFVKVPGGGVNYQVDHSGNIAILNARGHYVGFFKTPHDIDKMKRVYLSLRATE